MPTLQKTISSYLYTQYADDDDLQAFVDSYNQYTQAYVNTFNSLNLPIYTSPSITGPLLDWVSQGIYGYTRPALDQTSASTIGPLDTYEPNTKNVTLNYELTTSATTVAVSDDMLKRLLTWHFYKGDGKVFNVRWLKRRIMRFLIGTNGTAPDIDQTNQISVTFGSGNAVTITMPTYPLANALAAAIASGAAELPFQFTFTIVVSGPVGSLVTWRNNSSSAVTWTNNSAATVTWNNYGF